MHVIRYRDLKRAIDPKRRLVKLSDPNLWKPPWPLTIEDWQEGHEIYSDAIGISLFTSGTSEKLHYHERTWEIYQVLEGSLRIAVKPLNNGTWSTVVLHKLDMIMLAPGTLHLVDSTSDHTTQVIQAPAAASDQRIIPENPDHITEQERREIEAAEQALRGTHKDDV